MTNFTFYQVFPENVFSNPPFSLGPELSREQYKQPTTSKFDKKRVSKNIGRMLYMGAYTLSSNSDKRIDTLAMNYMVTSTDRGNKARHKLLVT